MMEKTKEIVIVTGATRGIGKAISLKLASEGYEVIPFGRDRKLLEEIGSSLQEFGTGQDYYSGDVSDEKFVNESVASILDKFGTIHHLINNAGIAVFEEFVDSTLEQFRKQIDTNVYGVYNFCKAVSDEFIKQHRGSIINISSLAGKNGFPKGTMYSASKHAVQGFTKSLMLELREYNIKVASVCPGSVATEMIIDSPMQPSNIDKILSPDNVAEVVLTMLKLPVNALVSEVEIRPTNPK